MRFRSKPIEIEAECFRPHEGPLPFSGRGDPCLFGPYGDGRHGWHIETLEGPFVLSDGDWVIRGLRGEFYPCKPDVFVAKYAPVEAKP